MSDAIPAASPWTFVRDWRPGDSPTIRRRTLWRHEVLAEESWLHPTEVVALGLTTRMREALARQEAAGPDQEAGSPDVRPPSRDDPTAVSAEEFWADGSLARTLPTHREPGAAPWERIGRAWLGQARREALTDDDGTLRVDPPEGLMTWREAMADVGARWPLATTSGHEAPYGASYHHAPAAPPPSGEQNGWRWWLVEDPAGDLIAYDNRAAVQDWDDRVHRHNRHAPGAALGYAQTETELGPRPALVQGSVPVAVARAALDRLGDREAERRPAYLTVRGEVLRDPAVADLRANDDPPTEAPPRPRPRVDGGRHYG